MARVLCPASGICQRGNGLNGRLPQPPAAAASRVPAGQESSAVPDGADALHGIQYADHNFSQAKDAVAQTAHDHSDRFHFCDGNSSDSDCKFPTGVNSPSFLESLRINTRIISSSSLEELHLVVREEVKNMQQCALGSVNVSSALHRAAVLWKEQLGGGLGGEARSTSTSQSPTPHELSERKKVCLTIRCIQIDCHMLKSLPEMKEGYFIHPVYC
jgi:hypothetical protein